MGLDVAVFHLVNRASANPLFDALMPWLTDGRVVQCTLLLAAAAMLGWAYRSGEKESVSLAWRVVLVGLAAVVLCEFLSGRVLKPWIDRPRPPLALGADQVRLLVGVGSSRSFPSAHAHNTAAVATVIARGFPRLAPYALAYAAVIAYSRVYVGVHFPLDVLAGGLLGIVVAAALWEWSGRRARRP